jgi:hypothetical protein
MLPKNWKYFSRMFIYKQSSNSHRFAPPMNQHWLPKQKLLMIPQNQMNHSPNAPLLALLARLRIIRPTMIHPPHGNEVALTELEIGRISQTLMLEKKQIGERTHGAHRDRDAVELTDDAVYGGDASTDFKRALEQQKRRDASRQDRQAARIAALKEKEEARQQEMLERLGLTKR